MKKYLIMSFLFLFLFAADTFSQHQITSPFAPATMWRSAAVSVTTSSVIVTGIENREICLSSVSIYNNSTTATALALYETSGSGALKAAIGGPAKVGISYAFPTPICLEVNKSLFLSVTESGTIINATVSYFLAYPAQ